MSETTNKESEEFPDKEIFRFGTEKFDEVYIGEIKKSGSDRLYFAPREDCDYKMNYANMDDFINGWVMNETSSGKVKISCKPGKIIIERVEK